MRQAVWKAAGPVFAVKVLDVADRHRRGRLRADVSPCVIWGALQAVRKQETICERRNILSVRQPEAALFVSSDTCSVRQDEAT
jgi:hypothetical protein